MTVGYAWLAYYFLGISSVNRLSRNVLVVYNIN